MKEPSEFGGHTLPADFVTFGALQRDVVAFLAERPPEPLIGADEANQSAITGLRAAAAIISKEGIEPEGRLSIARSPG